MPDCPHQMCKELAECDIWPKIPEGSEFPQPTGPVNWELLKDLYEKPHPLIRDADPEGRHKDLHYGLIELLCEAKAVHHLLDLYDVPRRYSLDTDAIDSRVLIAMLGMGTLRERLARIAAWHQKETGPAGMVGDNCTECEYPWPCDTYLMANGTYQDPEDDDPAQDLNPGHLPQYPESADD